MFSSFSTAFWVILPFLPAVTQCGEKRSLFLGESSLSPSCGSMWLGEKKPLPGQSTPFSWLEFNTSGRKEEIPPPPPHSATSQTCWTSLVFSSVLGSPQISTVTWLTCAASDAQLGNMLPSSAIHKATEGHGKTVEVQKE